MSKWSMGKWNTFIWLIILAALQALTACTGNRAQGSTVSDSSVRAPEPTPTIVAGGAEAPMVAATATATGVTSPAATPTAAPTATPKPAVVPASAAMRLGLIVPIKGAHVPEWLDLIPGARRTYRAGVHEGVDFGFNSVGVTVRVGTPVLAAGVGVVIRADLDYLEPSAEQMARILADSRDRGATSPADLDKLRGRQVWIDHGQGVITRYAHLDNIATVVTAGAAVTTGQLIAYVGTSGDPDDGPAEQPHLHFEIRLGDSYLGEGLSPANARPLYVEALRGPNP